jgi:hypothetical protein
VEGAIGVMVGGFDPPGGIRKVTENNISLSQMGRNNMK